MTTLPKILLVVFVAMMVAVLAAPARACDNCNGGWGGWGGGWGWDMGYLYNQLDYNVPYFAAHPPVYYSYPVPRTYGYSPFAYPPGVMTPDVMIGEEVKPVEIVNPYVPKEQQQAAGVDQSAEHRNSTEPQPLVIMNPFVAGAKSIAQAGK
ncbi:MAG: hypothetical protein AB7G28_17770 [Pirellulales bacterium]